MEVTDTLPVELPTNDTNLTRLFYLFVLVPTVLGVAHHIDHIIRGNHVGWPITPHVNPFTYSLAIYPLLAISLYLTLTRRVEARYWAGFFAFSAGMLAYFHISPWAVEPPQDVVLPYANPLAGYLAFGIVLALIASVVIGAVYGTGHICPEHTRISGGKSPYGGGIFITIAGQVQTGGPNHGTRGRQTELCASGGR